MKENKVLATVNGRPITQQDVDAFLQRLGSERAMQFRSKEGVQKILNELINQQLFYADAVEKGLEQEEAFKAELEQAKVNILIQYAINNIMMDVKVEEDEVKDYYEKHKEQFKKPESVRASHILTEDEVTANKILKQIKEGLSFEEGANTYSKCSSEQNGGDLGYFSRGKMVQEFEDAVFSMQIGEISKPVKTQFGYHIIKLVDKKEADISTLEEVKERLTQHLLAMKQNDLYTDKGNELKKKFEVKIHE